MSKIQDALDRARRGSAPHGSRLPALVAEPVQSSQSLTVMREPSLLAPDVLESHNIVHAASGDRKALEAYRSLRTVMTRGLDVGRGSVICVTSVVPEADDGMVALNLSVSIAGDESRSALVIDCDLSRPTIAAILDLPEGPGLQDYLDDHSLDASRVIRSAGIPRLRVITAGHADVGSDPFLRVRMKRLIEELRMTYNDRVVVIHAPPLAGNSDALALIEQSDCVVLAVPYGKATAKDIANAIELAGSKRIMGSVLFDEPQIPKLGFRTILAESFKKLARPADIARALFGANGKS